MKILIFSQTHHGIDGRSNFLPKNARNTLPLKHEMSVKYDKLTVHIHKSKFYLGLIMNFERISACLRFRLNFKLLKFEARDLKK